MRRGSSSTTTETGRSRATARRSLLRRPWLGALQSIIEWIIQGADFTKLDADAHVGRRAIALFWTLNPDYFEGISERFVFCAYVSFGHRNWRRRRRQDSETSARTFF